MAVLGLQTLEPITANHTLSATTVHSRTHVLADPGLTDGRQAQVYYSSVHKWCSNASTDRDAAHGLT